MQVIHTFLLALPALGLSQDPGAAREFQELEAAWRQATRIERSATWAPRLLDFAERHPEAPAAVKALNLVVTSDNDQAWERAFDLIRTRHVRAPGLEPACLALTTFSWYRAEEFLEEVLSRNPHRSVQGAACFALAHNLVGSLAFGGGARRAEAERLFERVAAEYGDLPYEPGRTLGEAARGWLRTLRDLRPGRPAPEIAGEDVAGRPMRLSDYRGKVVLLVFWGFW